MNAVDLLIILLLGLGIINGYRKGFIGSLVGIAGSLAGLFTAYRYYPVVTQWLNEKFGLNEILGGYFNEHLVLPQAVSQFKLESLGISKIVELGTLLDKVDMPEALHAQLLFYLDRLQATLVLPASMSLGDVIHQFLATIVINGVAFMVIWLVVAMLINLVAAAVTKFTTGTVLGGINCVGGMVLGLLLRVFTLTILIGSISPLFNLAELTEPSLFSSVLSTINEAETIPYFIDLFEFVSEKIVNLILL